MAHQLPHCQGEPAVSHRHPPSWGLTWPQPGSDHPQVRSLHLQQHHQQWALCCCGVRWLRWPFRCENPGLCVALLVGKPTSQLKHVAVLDVCWQNLWLFFCLPCNYWLRSQSGDNHVSHICCQPCAVEICAKCWLTANIRSKDGISLSCRKCKPRA